MLRKITMKESDGRDLSMSSHWLCSAGTPCYFYEPCMVKKHLVCLHDLRKINRYGTKLRVLSHLDYFCLAPKLMICSKSICIFPLGRFVFTLHYCKVGQHTPSQGSPYAPTSPPHASQLQQQNEWWNNFPDVGHHTHKFIKS